jgi:uncharacterized protein (TIGR03435 family)
MPDLDDITLLRQYSENNSESAVATLVERHVNLVYSVALRGTGNTHTAGEITQAVFIILARKARGLSQRTILPGWLYQTTRLTTANFLRTEIRRQKREQEAYMQSLLNEPEPDIWPQIAPFLDDAVSRLGEKDRNAIVLRFFENKNLQEVGAALGASEDATKMRVNRALEKLRKFFTKRGVTLSAGAIAGAVSANSVHAAPMGLAKKFSAVAIAKGAAASGSTLTLIKGALKIMAWTKVKTAIVSGVVVLLAAGTTTITVKEFQEHRTYPWQQGEAGVFDRSVLRQQPPQVRILSSRFTNWAMGYSDDQSHKMMGTGVSAQTLVSIAYGNDAPARTMLSTKLPEGRYDFIASLPNGNAEALQREIKGKFGVIARHETRDADVLLLKMKYPNASGLKRSPQRLNESMVWKDSGSWLEFRNEPLIDLSSEAEALANIPIIDETGLTNRFDFNLNCNETDLENRNWNNVNGALDPLGLELVLTNMPVRMLVVEKAN